MHYIIIRTINSKCFNNKMDRTWKKYIKQLIKKYKFDKTVLLTLFEYCNNKKSLDPKYIMEVADTWIKNNIRTGDDLNNYYKLCNNIEEVKKYIYKHRGKRITQFEEEFYIKKWIIKYKLSNDEIFKAIKKLGCNNFNLDKLDDKFERAMIN